MGLRVLRAAHGLAVITTLCLSAGCGREYDGDRRYALSGTVTADGQPVDAGAISFIPTDHDKQRVSGGAISNGAYSVEEESGANAGKYRVEIRWYKKTGKMVKDPLTGDMIEERKEGLPKRFHQDSELTADVSADQNKFDFDLKSE